MANGKSKQVVVTATVTFGGTSYDCRKIPGGIPESCEPPDVTVLADVEQRFEASALTQDDAVELEMVSAPSLNAKAALVLTLKVSEAGATATSSTVNLGDCIVTNIEPSSVEAGGDRVKTYTVTFQPVGTRT